MRWLKAGGVIFGAVVITALGIDAADTLQGTSGTLLGQLAGSTAGTCPVGMLAVPAATTFRCVDQYEASPNEECPVVQPINQFDTQKNLTDTACWADSRAEVEPWRHVDRESAQLACVRAGKRLPTSEEWQLLAVGTPDTDVCNTDTRSIAETGSSDGCRSAIGAYDAIGNVWEWTHDDIFDGVYNGRLLPDSGYVSQVDRGGVATMSSSTPVEQFFADYVWSEAEGAFAMMRGGFYGSGNDAGVYSVHAATLPTMQGAAIGFRCVQ